MRKEQARAGGTEDLSLVTILPRQADRGGSKIIRNLKIYIGFIMQTSSPKIWKLHANNI